MSEIQRIITLVYILFQMGFSNEHYINLSSKQEIQNTCTFVRAM